MGRPGVHGIKPSPYAQSNQFACPESQPNSRLSSGRGAPDIYNSAGIGVSWYAIQTAISKCNLSHHTRAQIVVAHVINMFVSDALTAATWTGPFLSDSLLLFLPLSPSPSLPLPPSPSLSLSLPPSLSQPRSTSLFPSSSFSPSLSFPHPLPLPPPPSRALPPDVLLQVQRCVHWLLPRRWCACI
jgi:hypothetical protein